jgi:hypothetical protein
MQIESEISKVSELREQESRLIKEVGGLTSKRDELLKEISQLSPLAAQTLGFKNPHAIPPDALKSSVDAFRSIGGGAPVPNSGPDSVVVRVYSRDIDRDLDTTVVLPRIQKLGFKVAQVPGRPSISNLHTNAVWFGEAVSTGDVRLVALVLMAAGVQLKPIRPFSDPSGGKSHLIEIGADINYVNAPNLTVEFVKAALLFRR